MQKRITLLLSLLIVITSKSQFFNYLKTNASTITGTYTDLGTNGTVINTSYSGGALASVDDNSSVQQIGFTFNFSGTNFTEFVLNTNGFIKLGNTPVPMPDSRDVLASTSASATNVIYPLNLNLQPTANTEYRVATRGTAGSKICTIQFKAVADSGCPTCNPLSTIQFDAMEFQINLYETSNIIEFVYGSFSANINPSGFVPTNCGLKLNDAAHSLNVTKSSQTAFTGAAFIEGFYTGNRFNIRNNILPTAGDTYQFSPIPILTNNVALQTVYSLGRVPKLYDNTLSLYVQNIGATSYTNYPVTLTVTGANPYTNTQTLTTLNAGEKKLVTFPTFSWANIGTNVMAIKLPNDDDNGDNVDTARQDVTALTIGTYYDTAIEGNLGQSTSSIDMATRFKCPGADSTTPNFIKSVTTYFSTAGKTYRIYIYNANKDIVNDTPKVKLYSMTTNLTTVAGKNTYTFATPVKVYGDFFVNIVQLSTTTSLGMGFKVETPIRSKTFYFRSPQGSSTTTSGSWNDFAPNNSFRLMVDVGMQNAFLPVKLDNFSGFKEGKNNVLSWQTSSEINSIGFEVQRSNNGNNFNKIGFVQSRGNSNILSTYSYTDAEPLKGFNYYRLRQLDKDGKETYSEIIYIDRADKKNFEIVNVFPNPSKDNITLKFNSQSSDKVNINVTDLNGRVVYSQIINPFIGENNFKINTTLLSSGNYLITIAEMNTENFATTRFIKQ